MRDHKTRGDRLRLLKKVGKNEVMYVGEFEVCEPAYRWLRSHEQHGGERKVIQFVLRPVETEEATN